MSNESRIGTQLREARLKKNISIDELQKQTKIQKRYLEAIEEGKFDVLPGEYYVRAFVRQYAAVVGLDGEALVSLFDGKTAQREKTRPQALVAGGSRQQNSHKKRNQWTDFMPMIVLALLAFTVLSVVFYISWSDRRSQPYIRTVESAPSSSKTEQSKPKESKPAESKPPVEKPKEMKVERVSSTQDLVAMKVTDAKKPFKLTFTGKDGRCWVGVLVNNTFVYQFTFNPGVTQDFTLPENVTNAQIIMGASAFIDIKANDQAVDFNDPQFKPLKKTVQLDVAYLN